MWPQAITLLNSAQELDKFGNGTYYTNVVGAEGTRQLHSFLSGIAGRVASHLYPGAAPFGDTYVTAGPNISLTMPRADTDAGGDLYCPNLQQWKMDVRASSPAGLQEVVVMDGDKIIRRFLPGGAKEFNYATTIGKERQKYVWLRATDLNNRQAFGRAINCNSWLLRENQCADRNNQLMDSRQVRADGTPYFMGYGGDCAMPDKGPWNGRLRPIGCYVFDQKLGVPPSVYDGSPENHPQAFLAPSVWYNSVPPKSVGWLRHLVTGIEGAPHVKPYRVVASSEVLVADRILDGVFPCNDDPVNHVWSAVYPVKPSEYLKTTARTTFYLGKVDGITAYLWEQDLEFLKDIPVDPKNPVFFCAGTFGWGGNAREWRYVQNDQAKGGDLLKGGTKPHILEYSFNKGDYYVYTGNPFGGMAVYSLTDGLYINGDGASRQVLLKSDGNAVKAGSKFKIRLLIVGMHREFPDHYGLAAKVKADFGLGAKPSYQVECKEGKITSQEYTLDAVAGENYGLVAMIRNVNKLDGNLGLRLSGLNSNWSTWLQLQAEANKTRLIPVEAGIGYAVLRCEDEGKTLFVGHPVIAYQPDIVLNVARSQDSKTWQLEVHNPTEKAVTVRVVSNPQVKGIKLDESLELAPGSSQMRELGPAQE